MKTEYQTRSRFVDDCAAGRWEALGITNSASERAGGSNELRRVFNADKTRAQFARTTRALLKGIPKPFCVTTWPEYSHTRTVAWAWVQWAFRRKHNAQGDRLFAMMAPSLRTFFERKSQENVNVRATQVLLALKIFATRHHRLPASLKELTPEFFPRVPADDFDGKALRYSPDGKLIYSIGPDLSDSRGRKRPEGDDLPFAIEF